MIEFRFKCFFLSFFFFWFFWSLEITYPTADSYINWRLNYKQRFIDNLNFVYFITLIDTSIGNFVFFHIALFTAHILGCRDEEKTTTAMEWLGMRFMAHSRHTHTHPIYACCCWCALYVYVYVLSLLCTATTAPIRSYICSKCVLYAVRTHFLVSFTFNPCICESWFIDLLRYHHHHHHRIVYIIYAHTHNPYCSIVLL